MSCECTGVAGDSSARDGRTLSAIPGDAAGAAEPSSWQLSHVAWEGCTALGRDVRHVSLTRELRELSYRHPTGTRRDGDAGVWSRARAGGTPRTSDAGKPHPGVQ